MAIPRTRCVRAPHGRYHAGMSDVAVVLVAILIVVLVWRGPKTLPQLGKALGRGIREARREATGEGDDDESPTHPPEA